MSKRQSDPLDNAFLFLLGSLSLFFGLLNATFGSKQGLLLFSPMIISGLFYSFYVGYIEGVIGTMPLQRIRGWIYFFGGAVAYTYMLVIVVFRDYLKAFDYISTPIAFLVLAAGALCTRHSTKWVLKVTETTITPEIRGSLYYSGFAAFALSASVFFLEEFARLWLERNEFADLMHLFPSVIFFLLFMFLRWMSTK